MLGGIVTVLVISLAAHQASVKEAHAQDGFMARQGRPSPSRTAAPAPPVMSADAVRLRCVSKDVRPMIMIVDAAKQLIDFNGELFYQGKIEHVSNGKDYHYKVLFQERSIIFQKVQGNSVFVTGTLDRASLDLTMSFFSLLGTRFECKKVPNKNAL